MFEGPILDAVEARVNGKTSEPSTSGKHGLNRVTKLNDATRY